MALATSLQIKCGVTVRIPFGIGFTFVAFFFGYFIIILKAARSSIESRPLDDSTLVAFLFNSFQVSKFKLTESLNFIPHFCCAFKLKLLCSFLHLLCKVLNYARDLFRRNLKYIYITLFNRWNCKIIRLIYR